MKGQRRMMFRLGAGALASFLIAGAALTGSANADTATKKKIIFNVGVTSDMVSPNPFKACCGSEYEMMFMNYDMLFGFSKDDLSASSDSGLAESYTKNADNTSFTFKIRDGIKWSDGKPLTAADIVFTYNFILNNHMGAFINYLDAKSSPTFAAPNATTFTWKTELSTIAPLTPPWIPILPEHIWSKFDGDPTGAKAFQNVPAVGSGPFNLVSWDEGSGWKMVANKDYWYQSPTIDEVDYQVFSNQEGMVQALKSGQVDFAEALIPSLFKSLQGEPNIGTQVAPPGYFDNFAYNFGGQGQDATNLPALHDLVVRQAIATAIDTNAIVSKLMLGFGTTGTSVTLPGSPWFWEPPADQQYTFDIAKANQMLDDAGYKDTNEDAIRNDPKTGDELIIDTLTLTNLTYSQDEGKLIKDWLAQIGIEVNLQPVSESKAYDVWASGDFDAYIWDWGGDPDPDFILSIFTTDQCLSWSDGCYTNSQFDQMYAHQKTILDPAERNKYIQTMQDFLYKQQPEVVLAYENDLQAYRSDRFTGYVPVPSKGGGYLLFGWGPYSYMNLKPIAGASTGSGGVSTGMWLIVVLGLVVIGGGVALMRRRRPDEDRA